MIGYVTIGSSNLDKSAAFFDSVLSELGAKQQFRNDRMISWGTGNGAGLMACTPYDGKAPSVGNGTMVALRADGKEQVEKTYKKAIGQGAADEGAPGFRGPEAMGFYGSYFRDPDGNKICVFCIARG